MGTYQDDFYINRHEKTVYSAETILNIVIEIIPGIKSAVDIGCGVGTWLLVLKEKGVYDILGIDGEWVNKDRLLISSNNFMSHDLNKDIKINKKYDLAISLEVAEHVFPNNAEKFISSLTKLSNFILFSGAITGQGGKNHYNEKWLDYWNALFSKHSFIGVDVIRNKIWNDKLIPFWYRQNIVLFIKEERIQDVKLPCGINEAYPLSIVHPELYILKTDKISITQSLSLLIKAIKSYIKGETKNEMENKL